MIINAEVGKFLTICTRGPIPRQGEVFVPVLWTVTAVHWQSSEFIHLLVRQAHRGQQCR